MGDAFLLWLMSLPSAIKTGASSTEGSPAVSTPWPSGSASSTYRLVPADPASSQESQGTEVLLVGLKPSAQYRATVYSQAADGTEGQPQAIEFRTSMLDFVQ